MTRGGRPAGSEGGPPAARVSGPAAAAVASAPHAASPDAWPRWRVFPPVALGVIMATLDASVVNIALPTLQRTFRTGLGTIEWVALAYSLTMTGLLLAAGRLADARGRRGIYGAGLLLFTAASLLCGLAPTAASLIALRVVQGLAAALVSANGSALLVQSFPESERGRALGAFGAMVGVGLAIGPPLGGLVVANASWRWIFFVNLPLGLLAFWMLRRRVPPDAHASDTRELQGWLPLLWALGLASLMLALTRGAEHGWGDTFTVVPALVGVVLLAVFAATQRRASQPLLPLDILSGPFGAAVALTFLGQLLSVSLGFHLPLVMEALGHWTAARSGAWLAILPGAALLCAPIAGRLADRVGARPLTSAGMLLTAAGMALLSRLDERLSPAILATGMALVGVGQGLFAIPNASMLLSLVAPERLGVASGLQGTARNLGIASGVALTGAVVTMRYRALAGSPLALGGPAPLDPAAFRIATSQAFTGLVVVALLAALLAWWAGTDHRPKPSASSGSKT